MTPEHKKKLFELQPGDSDNNPHAELRAVWEAQKASGVEMEWLVRPSNSRSWIGPEGYLRSEDIEASYWYRTEPLWECKTLGIRIRPIPLRQFEVILTHKPMREEPEKGTLVWEPNPSRPACPLSYYWNRDKHLNNLLTAGLCYATAEGAIERGRAMRKIGMV